jgi:hypothetical protein
MTNILFRVVIHTRTLHRIVCIIFIRRASISREEWEKKVEEVGSDREDLGKAGLIVCQGSGG